MLGVLYARVLRRPILTWGATAAEAGARLPGDELLRCRWHRYPGNHDRGASGRGLALACANGPVTSRGCAYTYDWVENLLGLDMHSVNDVLPEFQDPQVGDTIGFGTNRMRFEQVEPEHALAMRSEDGNWVWTFVLEEHDGKTRLISRNRFRLPTLTARIGMLPMEPGSLVMERKMLRGIKERAERLSQA